MFADSVLAYFAAALIAYLLGSVSGAIVSSHVGHHEDIRDFGSGNAGMTNALRTYGIRHAAIVAAIDILKTVAAILAAKWLIGWKWGFVIGSLFAIAGHLFPVYYGFKGGKGILVTFAAMLAINWIPALILLGVFGVIVAINRYVSLGSIIAAACYPVAVYIFSVLQEDSCSVINLILSGLIGAMLIFMHRSNIKRLLSHSE